MNCVAHESSTYTLYYQPASALSLGTLYKHVFVIAMLPFYLGKC